MSLGTGAEMSLLENCPGLQAHQVEVPEAKPFDREKAYRLVRDAVSLLGSYYPAGALEWLRENRPDVTRFLKETEAELDRAVLDGDMAAFARTLEVYTRSHQRAFRIYEERPPVVEAQGEMS